MNDVNKLAIEESGKWYDQEGSSAEFTHPTHVYVDGFIAGWNKREEASAEGFGAFLETICDANHVSYSDKLTLQRTWQAARISADKEIRKEIQDLKDENKGLREMLSKMGGARLAEENKELNDKLQKIIQEDFINEDAYGWSQYCQSMIYEYDKEIEHLKLISADHSRVMDENSELKKYLKYCVDELDEDAKKSGYENYSGQTEEIRTKWGIK
jgi:hypothetical protein